MTDIATRWEDWIVEGDWIYPFRLYHSLAELIGELGSLEFDIESCSKLREKFGDWSDDDFSCMSGLNYEEFCFDPEREESWASVLKRMESSLQEALTHVSKVSKWLYEFAHFLMSASRRQVQTLSYGIGCSFSPDWIGRVRIALNNLLTIEPDETIESEWAYFAQPESIRNRKSQDEKFRGFRERALKELLIRISGQAGGSTWLPLQSESGVFLTECWELLWSSTALGKAKPYFSEVESSNRDDESVYEENLEPNIDELVPLVIECFEEHGWDAKVEFVRRKLGKRKDDVRRAMKFARLTRERVPGSE
ncbi:MAG: hypothetical protein O2820_06215 [Planctomycetota bacterium]|nr:hypothetical protein [Planctomycetota bacterium]MDA1248803.1 hypothetical protein [Planctomycetota bacterium]